MAVIGPGAIGAGSGAAVFLTASHSAADRPLFLNTIDYFIQRLRLRPISIDFEHLPDGSDVFSGSIISHQYQSLGVVFSSDDLLALGLSALAAGGQANSAPGLVLAGSAPGTQLTATFVDPRSGQSGVTNYVAVTPAEGPDTAKRELAALDLGGQVVATATVDFSPSAPVEIHTSRRVIHQLKLTTSGPIDHFRFAQVTPEPVCVGFDRFPDGSDVFSGSIISDQ